MSTRGPPSDTGPGADLGPDAPGAPSPDTSELEAPAFTKVDALFAGEPPPPPAEAGARIQRLVWLLAVAIPLDLLGIPCCTGVPGAALTIWAWLAVDVEIARVEAGEYSSEDAATFLRLRTLTRWAMVFCVASLIAQIMLFYTPFYARWWGVIGAVLRRVFGP